MIRRTTDRIQITVSIATLIGLFSILYTISKDFYQALQDRLTKFEAQWSQVVKDQNAAIKEIRDRCRK